MRASKLNTNTTLHLKIREDMLMVLNQVHPSRCATSNPSQQGHLPGAWGCRHRRQQGFAANFFSDASLPDWLEGGGGPLANTSSQKPESLEHRQLKTQERQEHKSAMRHGNWWPGSARGISCLYTIYLPSSLAECGS